MNVFLKKFRTGINIIYSFLTSFNCNKHAHLLTAQETIAYVTEENCSVIRLGDGELEILLGNNIHYQVYSDKLRNHLTETINGYLKQHDCNYLLCMPNDYLRCSSLEIARTLRSIKCWSRFRKQFLKNYDLEIEYGDSFLFHKKYEKLYKQLWNNKQIALFLHNDIKYAVKFESKYDIETVFYKIPPQNAYEEYSTIICDVKKIISNLNCDLNSLIVLISAGPCGKIIAWELSKCDIYAVDAGHCWDEMVIVNGALTWARM